MFKIHKSNECITAKDSYILKQIVISPVDTGFKNQHKDKAKSPQDIQKEAEKEAADIVAKAEAKAREILSRAEREAGKIIEKITQDAFEQGYQEGKKQGAEEFGAVIEEAKTALGEIRQEKYGVMKELEPEIVGFCIKIAEKIIGSSIATDQGKFVSLIANALRNAEAAEKISVFVHPLQYDKVSELKQMLISGAGSAKNIDIFKDEALKELDCLIETDCGVIDAGVESQIKRAQQAFELKEVCV